MNKKKIALVALFITAVTLFFVLDLGQYLNLAYIKSQQQWQSAFETKWVKIFSKICEIEFTNLIFHATRSS